MQLLVCKALGIPEYLHRDGRPIDEEFNSELIYRRFNIAGNPSEWIKDKSISTVIFEVKNDSCNREKYCKTPSDVLFNTRPEDKGAHYEHHGIISFNSDVVQYFNESLELNDTKRQFTLKMVHYPNDCMYPHCEIHVYENGIYVDSGKPKSIKALIRDILIGACEVIKYPTNI